MTAAKKKVFKPAPIKAVDSETEQLTFDEALRRHDAGVRAAQTREKRERYVATKVEAYRRTYGKEPPKSFVEEQTDKAKQVILE